MIMTKSQNKSTGKIGEDLAVDLLINKGYQILERNWGNKWGEIDIIAKDDEILVFVEVKTKIGDFFGTPEEMVNHHKLSQLQKIASSYSSSENSPKRIDIVAIVLSPDLSPERINHYQAVY